MSYSIFLLGLLVVSTLTGLVTEAIKKQLEECGRSYKANLLAGTVALALSAAISVGYTIMTETVWTAQLVVVAVAMMLLSWLCAMLGYDKVIQAISQFKQD